MRPPLKEQTGRSSSHRVFAAYAPKVSHPANSDAMALGPAYRHVTINIETASGKIFVVADSHKTSRRADQLSSLDDGWLGVCDEGSKEDCDRDAAASGPLKAIDKNRVLN
jgi:hypothetical protein